MIVHLSAPIRAMVEEAAIGDHSIDAEAFCMDAYEESKPKKPCSHCNGRGLRASAYFPVPCPKCKMSGVQSD